MICGRVICLMTLLVLLCPRLAAAQNVLDWHGRQAAAVEKSERILNNAQKRKGLLAQYQVMRYAYAGDKDPAFRVIFGQYLSWYQTFIGDYPDALQSFSIRETVQSDDAPSPTGMTGFHPVQALAYIPELAKNYRAIFLNEAHNVPVTRSLSVQLLKPLRDEGFNTFAVETLYQTDKNLQTRGYPTDASGFYTEEPVHAEMVRTALKLGFKVVAYEADENHSGDAREAQQARNLWNILKDDPNARLVVDAGYAHIQKRGRFLGGQSMAEHFVEISHLDPLTVEQTILISHDSGMSDHPYYTQVIESLQPKQPVVFVDKDGKPWSLRPGYDVSVFFPKTQMHLGRPTWLSLGGLRQPYFVDGGLCQHQYPCLVEARYANEGNDAIPADRMALDPVPLISTPQEHISLNYNNTPSTELYLRPGRYRLTAVDENGRVLTSENISVNAAATAQTP